MTETGRAQIPFKFFFLMGLVFIAPLLVRGDFVPTGGAMSPERYARTVGDPQQSGPDFSPAPGAGDPIRSDWEPAPSAEESAKEKRFLRRLNIDIGSDTNPDLLAPTGPKGLDRDIDMDYRVVFQDDRLGLNVHRYDRARGRKLSLSFRQRLDFPTLVGLGGTRNGVYKSLGQKTRGRDVSGYVSGFAVTFNHYWGASISHDEFFKDAPAIRFSKQTTSVGFGYSPLGDNREKLWSFTIDPAVIYEKYHELIPVAGARYESFGYSLGTSFYFGLEDVTVPRLLGPQRRSRLDRLKLSVGISDSEVSPLALGSDVNVTAYVTRHIKLKVGGTHSYQVPTGKHVFHLKVGASLRFSLRDLHF